MYKYLVNQLAVPLNKAVYYFNLFRGITDGLDRSTPLTGANRVPLRNLAKDFARVSAFDRLSFPLNLVCDRTEGFNVRQVPVSTAQFNINKTSSAIDLNLLLGSLDFFFKPSC